MKLILILGNFFILLVCCSPQENLSKIEILPLHPYEESPLDNHHFKNETYIAKYYFIRNAFLATDGLSFKLDSFIVTSLEMDKTDFDEYGGYYLYFYRESDNINVNFRQNLDGLFTNPLSSFQKDLLFRYEWSGKKFKGCQYYRKGKVFKTLYGKKGDLFKQTYFPKPGDNRPIRIKEVEE